MKKLVITRHSALVEFLLSQGIIKKDIFSNEPIDYEVINHVDFVADIRDRDVIGVLPLWMAFQTRTMTTVDMSIPREMYGKDLSLEDMKKYVKGISTYRFTEMPLNCRNIEYFASMVVAPYDEMENFISSYGWGLTYDGYNSVLPVVARKATETLVKGEYVACNEIPLYLAAQADCVATIPLHIPENLRGKKLSEQEMRFYAGKPLCYRVDRVGVTRNIDGSEIIVYTHHKDGRKEFFKKYHCHPLLNDVQQNLIQIECYNIKELAEKGANKISIEKDDIPLCESEISEYGKLSKWILME